MWEYEVKGRSYKIIPDHDSNVSHETETSQFEVASKIEIERVEADAYD